eukprot:7159964-Alexandrium_andersonii.AAC.1
MPCGGLMLTAQLHGRCPWPVPDVKVRTPKEQPPAHGKRRSSGFAGASGAALVLGNRNSQWRPPTCLRSSSVQVPLAAPLTKSWWPNSERAHGGWRALLWSEHPL